MMLQNAIDLFCSIGSTATAVFNKKVGKTKGLDQISDDLTDIATQNAVSTFGSELDDDTQQAISEFVDGRLKLLKHSFRQLNNGSITRNPDLINRTETDAATWFGQTKGYEARGNNVHKVWVVMDPCDECANNEAVGPIPVGEEFPSGDYAPPAHPNCMCDLEYTNEDGEALED